MCGVKDEEDVDAMVAEIDWHDREEEDEDLNDLSFVDEEEEEDGDEDDVAAAPGAVPTPDVREGNQVSKRPKID